MAQYPDEKLLRAYAEQARSFAGRAAQQMTPPSAAEIPAQEYAPTIPPTAAPIRQTAPPPVEAPSMPESVPVIPPDDTPPAQEYAPAIPPTAAPSMTDERQAALRQRYPGRGKLRVQVSAGGGSFPVAGATVEVSALVDGKPYRIYSLVTDSSGIAEGMSLPAGPLAASQEESTAADSGVTYYVSVYRPGFLAVDRRPVTAYDGVETILPVGLVPLVTEGGN